VTSEPHDGSRKGAPPAGFPVAEVGLPPVVYVPSQPAEPGETEVNLELRYLTDGQVAVLAYTSLDRLVSACGRAQPWALLHSEQLWELRDSGTVHVIVVDPEVPAELRRDGPEQPVERWVDGAQDAGVRREREIGGSAGRGREGSGGDGSQARASQRDRWPVTPSTGP
jgi:hypothetical protein